MLALARRSALTPFVHPPLRFLSSTALPRKKLEPKSAQSLLETVDDVPIAANPANAKLLELVLNSDVKFESKRARTYAINAVAGYPDPIKTLKDVTNLGVKDTQRMQIINFMSEAATSGEEAAYKTAIAHTARVHALRNRLCTLPYFAGVTAQKVINAGCSSMEQLVTDDALRKMLSPKQQKLVSWYNHFIQPISRQSIEALVTFIESYFKPSGWEVIASGSYRRDAAEMSEIDLLFIHHSQGYLHPPSPVTPVDRHRRKEIQLLVKERILDTLQSRGTLGEQFFWDHATTEVMIRVPLRTANGGWETPRERLQNVENRQGEFHFCRIRMVSSKSKGATLLCTTGDSEYVKYVKDAANKLGLILNEYGLWQFHPNDPSIRPAEIRTQLGTSSKAMLSKLLTDGYWELLPSDTEEQILEYLDLPYVRPDKRNFANIKM